MKKRLYVAFLDNGVDGPRPHTIVAKTLNGARSIAKRNTWAYVTDVFQCGTSCSDGVAMAGLWVLADLPNANNNRNPGVPSGFGYDTEGIVKAIGMKEV